MVSEMVTVMGNVWRTIWGMVHGNHWGKVQWKGLGKSFGKYSGNGLGKSFGNHLGKIWEWFGKWFREWFERMVWRKVWAIVWGKKDYHHHTNCLVSEFSFYPRDSVKRVQRYCTDHRNKCQCVILSI